MKKWGLKAGVAALLVVASAFLLKGDVWTFWTWWLLAALLGFLAMPVTGWLFCGFRDKGWLFSKVLSIAAAGFLTWLLVSVKVMKFTTWTCIGVTAVCAAGCFVLFLYEQKKNIQAFPEGELGLIIWEELLFFGIFLLWTYFAGFRPAAYGTEKFMDYGFMEAMMRSTTLPPRDLWYSQGHINYYYGGQYFAVFLTKLSGSSVALTYNLMRTFVAGLAFVLPFSLVFQMMTDWQQKRKNSVSKAMPSLAGLLAGGAVSLAGNMHYVIYGNLLPLIQKLQGKTEIDSYWFPNATRYIGYRPDVPDKTIHEFPSYSFILGDLHAHVVNVMFVLLLVGLLYAWVKKLKEPNLGEAADHKIFWKREIFMPHLLLAGGLLGMFQWTNFWDFVIYSVVTGGVALFTNIIRFKGKGRQILLVTAVQAVEVLFVSYVVILPFTLQFETMVQGVALAKTHSRIYQLLILWGLPAALTIAFLVSVTAEKLKTMEQKNPYRLLKAFQESDLFAVILGLCAIGLVLIPELVYVRDIYEESGFPRANTMFKLTYQAYIMFGIVMGYVIFRFFSLAGKKLLKGIAAVGLVCLLWTFGYLGNSVGAWLGEVWNPKNYQGLNAKAFLETDFAEDAAGIRWLSENIKDAPVVLEANGDSYTGYERVSAMTGLPTILGWKVHEWLWRNDVEDLNKKSQEIETIYTSENEEEVRALLEKYDVSYIFLGSMEREKYGEELNTTLLKSLGEVVFQDEAYQTCIIKTGE